MFCTHCGASVPANANFCGSCGSHAPTGLVPVGNDRAPVGVFPPRPSPIQLTDGPPTPVAARTAAPGQPAPPAPTPIVPQLPQFRGASINDISRAKTLSATDWDRVARDFKEWRKTVTLTVFGRWLGHNAAWDNYFAGYDAGVSEGVNRALNISTKEEADIDEILLEIEMSRGSASRVVRSGSHPGQVPPTIPSAGPQQTGSAHGPVKVVGAIICGFGIVGGITAVAAARDTQQAFANVGNMALFTAFGLATYRGKRAAIPLGWAYLALLGLMTVVHGLIPLEIFQCLALIGFLFYLRNQTSSNKRPQ